jgi:hypothetical protein
MSNAEGQTRWSGALSSIFFHEGFFGSERPQQPRPIRDSEFSVDVVQVDFYCAFNDAQSFCNDFIGKPKIDEIGDFKFPPRKGLILNAGHR